MHDTYRAGTWTTATCPHCAARVAAPCVSHYPGLHRALLDLVCPLGHVWHEVRTAASCARFWEPEGDSASGPARIDPPTPAMLLARPPAPRAASTPA